MIYKIQGVIEYAKKKITSLSVGLAALTFPVAMVVSSGAAAAVAPTFSVVPFEFVGTTAECGGPAGTDTVTAQWDDSTGNPAPSILLQKLGATSNCAAAGVDIITPLEGGPASALTELNYDYKDGEHCGAGAPRFNIQTNTGTAITLGCSSGTQTPSTTAGWTHVEFSSAQIAAAVASAGSGTTLQDLYIIFDEGADTPVGGTIGTAGTVHIDNISVNNQVVGSPTTPSNKDQCKNGGFKNFTDDNGDVFDNQGQCIRFVNPSHSVRKNINKVSINIHNRQNSTSGNVNINGNTTGGSGTSGSASNSNSTTNTINVSNF